MTRSALALLLAIPAAGLAAPATLPVDAAQRMRGVCYEGPRNPPVGNPFVDIAAMGATWVSLTPFAWMGSDREPELRFNPDARWWGESDEGIATSARLAHEAGLRVVLKPHIWVRSRGGAWHGSVRMASEEDWALWFDAYETWMDHCADLASHEHIEAIVVGHELAAASVDASREAQWRNVIASVREHCDSQVIWSAHWDREVERIPFWDAVDLIGVSMYCPISQSADPTSAEIAAAWQRQADRLSRLSERWHRPVVFTEIGYRSAADAASEPWLWRSDAAVDVDLQARLFEAAFEACWNQPWFAGLFVWKWHADGSAGGPLDGDFTPQGKPALGIIQRWFQGGEAL